MKKLARAHEDELAFLSSLGELVPPEMLAEEEDPVAEIEAAVAAQVFAEEGKPAAEEKPAPRIVAVGPDDDVPPMPDDLLPLPGMDDRELDPDATRRFSDMQFGKDYKIE